MTTSAAATLADVAGVLKIARAHYGANDFGSTRDAVRGILVAQPDQLDAVLLLGGALIGMRYWDAARAAFQRVETIRPTEGRHWRLYVRLLLRFRQLSHAGTIARRIVIRDPGSADGWEMLSRIQNLHGRTGDAKPYLRILDRLRPNDVSVAVALSRCMMALLDLDEAEFWCRRALQLGGEAPDKLFDLGRVLRAKRNFAESDAVLDRAAELDASFALKARVVRMTVTDAQFAGPGD